MTGRDILEKTYVVQFGDDYRWINLGDEVSVNEHEGQYEFYANPITKLVLNKLDSLEDMIGDDPAADSVEWTATSKELLDTLVQQYGVEGDSLTSVAVGRRVALLQDAFQKYEGIEYEHRRTNTLRVHAFKRYVMS